MAGTLKSRVATRESTARASITFPAEVYAELERLAEAQKVSVAWIVRDAVEKYVAAKYPLFSQQ